MFISDDAIDIAQRSVTWIPDPAVIAERLALAVRRRAELSRHNVPLDPPCDTCPARRVCNMVCSAFQQYLDAPVSHSKRLS